jgi:hypothetical protein
MLATGHPAHPDSIWGTHQGLAHRLPGVILEAPGSSPAMPRWSVAFPGGYRSHPRHAALERGAPTGWQGCIHCSIERHVGTTGPNARVHAKFGAGSGEHGCGPLWQGASPLPTAAEGRSPLDTRTSRARGPNELSWRCESAARVLHRRRCAACRGFDSWCGTGRPRSPDLQHHDPVHNDTVRGQRTRVAGWSASPSVERMPGPGVGGHLRVPCVQIGGRHCSAGPVLGARSRSSP